AHAFAHILYKALLFMGAGAVLQTTGLRKLSEMGGLYKTMPVTLGLYMIGAFAISAVPLFSGFVSKSMVVSAAGEVHRPVIFLLLRRLDPEPTISLDTDWFYRRGSASLVTFAQGPLARLESGFVGEIYESVIRRPVLGAANLFRSFDSLIVDSAIVGVGRSTQ